MVFSCIIWVRIIDCLADKVYKERNWFAQSIRLFRYRTVKVKQFIIVLLVLSVIANGTQAVVFCVGSDGHVAIEMAGHEHCHGSHSHGETETHEHHHCEDDHCSHEAAHHTDTFFETDHTCCGPHEEIPLSHGIVDDSRVQKTHGRVNLSTVIVTNYPDQIEDNPGIVVFAREGPSLASFYYPLTYIVLIV